MGACLSGLLRLVRGERRVYRQRREAVPLDELQPFLLEEEEEDDVEPLYARQPSESGAFERAPKARPRGPRPTRPTVTVRLSSAGPGRKLRFRTSRRGTRRR